MVLKSNSQRHDAGCSWTDDKSLFLNFLASLEALGTHVDVLLFTVLNQPNTLHIGVPPSLRMAHGMANVMSELWPLAATFTLGHRITPSRSYVNKLVTEPGGLGHS